MCLLRYRNWEDSSCLKPKTNCSGKEKGKSRGNKHQPGSMKEGKLCNLPLQTVPRTKNECSEVEKCVLYSLAEVKNDRVA